MKKHIENIVNYNLWANRRMCKSLEVLSEEQFVQHIESSYPSVKKTIEHIWGVENGWLKSIMRTPENYFPTFEGDSKALYENLIKGSENFIQYIENQPEEFLSTTFDVSYNNKTFTYQVHQAVQHCMNHSTYHRGQVYTMARQLGLEKFKGLDYISFVETKLS